MKTYDVTITETSVHTVRVEAESEEQAEQFALEDHLAGNSSFSHVEERDICARVFNNPSR